MNFTGFLSQIFKLFRRSCKEPKSCKFRFTRFNKIITRYFYNSTLLKFFNISSDVGRATLICSGCHGFESTGVKDIFSFSMWVISFLGPSLKRYILFRIFIRELQLATLRPLYMLNNVQRPNLTGYPFFYKFLSNSFKIFT